MRLLLISMDSKWLYAVLALFLLEGMWCQGCLEQERIALLQLKSFFNDPWELRNWGRGKENSDCCRWEWVECSPSNGRVIELHLDYMMSSSSYLHLNASLFLPFEELKNLSLVGNEIASCIENEGFHRLSKLSKLEFLDLSWNYFNDSILLPLSKFSSLKSLNLAGNDLQLSNHIDGFKRFSKLRSLEILDLSGNYLNNSILTYLSELPALKSLILVTCNLMKASNHSEGADFENLSRLSHLEFLDLSYNIDLSNNILSYLSSLSSLKTLILQRCGLKGTLNTRGFTRFSNLRDLEILDLSGNDLNISILTSLSELPSLKSLNLQQSNLRIESNHGNAVDFEKLSRLHHLEFLDLSLNYKLNNSILSYLSNFSSLKTLILHYCGLNGTLSIRELINLRNLKVLDISSNNIQCLESSQDEQNLRFVHLEVLDLRYNFFNNSVLSFINKFSNLKSLHIEGNNLKGLIDVTKFDALSNLEVLDMSNNDLNQFFATKASTSFNKLKALYLNEIFPMESSVPAQLSLEAFPSLKRLHLIGNYHLNQTIVFQTPHVLSNLEELFLDWSPLNVNFLQSMGVLTSLKSISLEGCGLTGTLPTQGWCDLKNLKEIDLRGNELVGILPSCLANLTSLRLLDISQNHFTGNVASSPLTDLILLQYLSISNNQFQVPESFKSFANHSNLKVFLSDFNQLVPEHNHIQTWVPKFQPRVFSMSNCRVDKNLIKPPSFLYYLYDLRFIDLSYDKFIGALPYWLFENNTRLQNVFMMNNTFVGPFHLPSHPSLDVLEIDISNNQIQGVIPLNISLIFPFLKGLFLSGNDFEGKFPNWLVSVNSLRILDLSSNKFSGIIPKEFGMGSNLENLKLSNNNLGGKIPSTVFKFQSLEELYLDKNNFEGEISSLQVSSSLSLWILDISNNNLSGELPRWTKNLTFLEELDLSYNHFHGSIPQEFCYNAEFWLLDLSHNNLSGSLPHCSHPPYLSHIYLSKNRLHGPLTHSFYNVSLLVILDLGENNLSGSIPKWIGNFSTLRILRLKGNHFFGEIPREICELDQLRIMDLSHNQLFGHIPSCLGHLIGGSTSASELFSLGIRIRVFSTSNDDTLTEMEKELIQELYEGKHDMLQAQIEVVTKWWSYTYKGDILDYMSGIDLSCNKLTGQIPLEMGNLSDIHLLNLSHNNLTGPIPFTFSNLKQLESMDLSFNILNGEIPSQLIGLNSLAIFSVAHNNLSGLIPYRKGQFGTFDKSSYEGNPLLCGPPLEKSCNETDSQPKVSNPLNELREGNLIDIDVFYISFVVTYVVVVLSIGAVLYINPYWRQTWFYLIERCITNCFYFIMDNLPRY